jgi:hypothetical protein
MLPAKPCLPTSAPCPPVGPDWLHEIKHDGYRMLAQHDGARARLIFWHGLDWGWRLNHDRRSDALELIVEGLAMQEMAAILETAPDFNPNMRVAELCTALGMTEEQVWQLAKSRAQSRLHFDSLQRDQ